MELKVWVEGIQRIVCGVTVNTTCQDVVFALAHATGKVGRFTLIERWRNNERHLAPKESPMKLLLKWGEYANDVQFILQRSENNQHHQKNATTDNLQSQYVLPPCNATTTKKRLGTSDNHSNNNKRSIGKFNNENKSLPTLMKQKSNVEISYRTKELKKNFSGYDTKQPDNVGVVKGIPKQQLQHQEPSKLKIPTNKTSNNNNKSLSPLILKHEKSHSNPLDMTSCTSAANGFSDFNNINNENDNENNNNSNQCFHSHLSKSSNELNLTEGRRLSPKKSNNDNNNGYFYQIYVDNNSNNNNAAFIPSPDVFMQTPTISANGALVPPPYRDPPPPHSTPLQLQQRLQNAETISNAASAIMAINNLNKPYLYDNANLIITDTNKKSSNNGNQSLDESESIFQATQYTDLLQLIKFQREKISTQQMELNEFDTEIIFLEAKDRDYCRELEDISRETSKADQNFRQGIEHLQTLQYVEEENELVKQQEKTLKSEIALLRSKLVNCETELIQCKNKIHLLMDDIELEQRALNNQPQTKAQNVEQDFLMEMERIQSEIHQALHTTDVSNNTVDKLKKELMVIENTIAEKKKLVEHLVKEMKEVNLLSLAVTTTDEIKNPVEAPNKQGSSRRIIGSPRQLETAVPTSKNPHGVWV